MKTADISFWVDRPKDKIGKDASYIELSLELWTFQFACREFRKLYVIAPAPPPVGLPMVTDCYV